MPEESQGAPSSDGVILSGRLVEVEPSRDYTASDGSTKQSGPRLHMLVGRAVAAIGFKDERAMAALVQGKGPLAPLQVRVRMPRVGSEFAGYWSAV